MVYTNIEYRGQGICKEGIKFLINKMNTKIKKYELEVLVDNKPAISCYEYNGFKIIKKDQHIKVSKNGDKKTIDFYLMELKL